MLQVLHCLQQQQSQIQSYSGPTSMLLASKPAREMQLWVKCIPIAGNGQRGKRRRRSSRVSQVSRSQLDQGFSNKAAWLKLRLKANGSTVVGLSIPFSCQLLHFSWQKNKHQLEMLSLKYFCKLNWYDALTNWPIIKPGNFYRLLKFIDLYDDAFFDLNFSACMYVTGRQLEFRTVNLKIQGLLRVKLIYYFYDNKSKICSIPMAILGVTWVNKWK